METARIEGLTLEYETAGKGEPVVLIHGALIADALKPLHAEPVLAEHYQRISYHRRGYAGSSPASGRVSVEQQATDCRELMNFLGLRRAHIVGHSFGGVIAMQLALDHPHMVGTLALLEPALVVGENGQSYLESLRRGSERYREDGAAAVVEDFLNVRFGEDQGSNLDRVLPGAHEQAVADVGTLYDCELPALEDWHFGEAEVRRITGPVLAVRGAKSDGLSPRFVETHEWLLNHVPGAEGFILANAAHELQMQNPSDLAEVLAEFFRRNPLSS